MHAYNQYYIGVQSNTVTSQESSRRPFHANSAIGGWQSCAERCDMAVPGNDRGREMLRP
jgi:hypothetical protein